MIPTIKRSLLGASLLVSLAAVSNAATLLVDINHDTATPFTQSGFTPYRASAQNQLQTTFAYADTVSGNLTFTVTGLSGDNNRDRTSPANSGAFTYNALYRDFIFDNATAGADSFDITFSGLVASTAYQFKFYAFDGGNANNGNTNTFTLNTAGATFNSIFINTTGATALAGPNGNSVTNSGNPTTNDQYAVFFTGTTNSSGNIGFTQTGSLFPTLNGFEIVPEPSSAMALVSSIALLLGIRRRRTA